MTTETIGFIGAGKVASTLAQIWTQRGLAVTHVWNRTPDRAKWLAARVGARAVNTTAAVTEHCSMTVIAISDDALLSVGTLLPVSQNLAGKAIVHTSGVYNAQVLSAYEHHGALVGSLHPVFPFAVFTVPADLLGATFGIEAEVPALSQRLTALTDRLDGHALYVPADAKALYHAAFVLLSNYTVTLYAQAFDLLKRYGEAPAIHQALLTLLSATARNLGQQGIPAALTGPVVRGDVATLEAHALALNPVNPALAEAYRLLALLTLPLAAQRGTDTTAMHSYLTRDSE